ncbi:MAG: sodium/proline symporter [Aureispira sp.]|nr:sodium/proline symporter [Aureispira sp.]
MNLAILIIYFGILFLIGILSSKEIKNIEDYYVGGKKLGYWVVAFSTRATGESAWLLLGLTGMGAIVGVSAFWVVVGEVIGVSVAWLLMAKRFKFLTDKYKSITVPDYLVSRFRAKSNTLRIIASTALAVFVVIYVSAQIDATGFAFEQFMGWNYYVGALVGFGIVVLYIFFGGFVAVALSDLFQGVLMFLGLFALPIVAYFMLDGDLSVGEKLHSIDPALTNMWGKGGLTAMNLATIAGFLLIGLGFMGSPQLFVRFMAIKDEEEINKGRWVAIFFTILTDASAVCVGLLGRYLFVDADTLGKGGEDVLMMLVNYAMPTVLVGVYIAVVLSAIMSTIDSLLVVASSAIIRDFYQQIYNPDIKVENLTNISRVVTIAMALFALGIAMTVALTTPDRTVFWFVIFGWSGIAATFCPVIILSLFWKGYTEKGAIASMITGFLGVPIFKFVVPTLDGIGPYFKELAELGPSFALAMLVGVVVSKLAPDQELADIMEKTFKEDRTKEELDHLIKD